MEHSPAHPQFHRFCHLCSYGVKSLGDTAGAGTWIAFDNRGAIRLGPFRFSNLCCLPDVESDVGHVYPGPQTMAKRHLLATDNSDLAGRSDNRLRAPLTMVGEKSRFHSSTTNKTKEKRTLVLTSACDRQRFF
jgi:hypothetical protein